MMMMTKDNKSIPQCDHEENDFLIPHVSLDFSQSECGTGSFLLANHNCESCKIGGEQPIEIADDHGFRARRSSQCTLLHDDPQRIG